MKFYITTYGCQMNVRDAEAAEALLQRGGHVVAATEDAADVVIVNTCSVREKAEAKALGKLGLLVAGKRERPGRLVGAMGCMVQRLGTDLFRKVPGVDFAVGTQVLARLPDVLARAARGEGAILEAGPNGDRQADLDGHRDGGASAFVNILLGCDRQCSYCVVPAVRGAEWSRPAMDILREVRAVAARGIREVTLLGQSVMSYGRKNAVWPDEYRSPRGLVEPLPRLLEAIQAVEGVARIRFTTGHPSGCTAELARAMAELPAVCEHLHLPCQSGCDRILQMMRRGYQADDYRQAVARLRRAVPALALTTDIIVGFPGEQERDFEMTMDLLEKVQYDGIFAFKYSKRPGTAALKLNDHLPDDVKEKRLAQVLDLQGKMTSRSNEKLVNSVQEVLVDGLSKKGGTLSARTRGNKAVNIDAPSVLIGSLVLVKIIAAGVNSLTGQLCE